MVNNTSIFTDKDWEDTASWLKSILKENVVTVVFTKTDGTERTMKCTTDSKLIPTQPVTESTRKPKKENPEVFAVYDVENAGWRSFKLKSIKSISFSLTANK